MATRRKGKRKGKGKIKAATRPKFKAIGKKPQDEVTDRPTPELAARVKFELGQITTETGAPYGFAYRRKPLFETMALGGGLSPDELAALRFYRTAFDRSERSPVRCCLDVGAGGRSGNAHTVLHATPAMIDAKRKLRMCEAALGHSLATMQGVALDDKSFSQLAMDRFGSRITHTRNGKPTVAPKSGRHRETIRGEFLQGLKLLTDHLRRAVTTGAVEEVWVDPLPDGAAVIRRSFVAPAGRYRCWGDNVLVDRVMSELEKKFGQDLRFSSAVLAIEALKQVEDGRLRHLEEEELAP